MKPQQATLVELIASHASTVPDWKARIFLDDENEHALTYGALHVQAQTSAHHLVQRGSRYAGRKKRNRHLPAHEAAA